jgi:two-component system sensor histidine kinase UhpB
MPMSLQLKLNLMITVFLLMLLSASSIFVVKNASEDVRAEVASTANLALHLLDAEIIHYTSDFGWLSNSSNSHQSIFRLQELGSIRHLKIEFYDVYGKLRESNHQFRNGKIAPPPAWFVQAMNLSASTLQEHRRTIVINGRHIGDLIITADPSYEIAEIWDDAVGYLTLLIASFLLINSFVFLAVRSTFKPVGKIIDGLDEMEKGNFSKRLPVINQIELRAISQKFNVMADALQKSTSNNRRLTQQIIRLQEIERKTLAQDIHDEIGQYLTAIHVDASAIVGSRNLSLAKESAQAISVLSMQMMDIVRELLQRLRPRAIDDLGLELALKELVAYWKLRQKRLLVSQSIPESLGQIDEDVSITIYRMVQECLTNISKHAHAKRIVVMVKDESKFVVISVEDDGVGFNTEVARQGYGLLGMKERVQGLGGVMEVVSVAGRGTKINAKIPKHIDKRIESENDGPD